MNKKFYLFIALLVGVLAICALRPVLAQKDPNAAADTATSTGPSAPDNQQTTSPAKDNAIGSGNNQVISSRDAIGLRIVPNPQHYSPLKWYENNIKVKGAPQTILVDGYEAIRDGRTVYVNAAKVVKVNRCSNNSAVICTTNNDCGANPSVESWLPFNLTETAWAATCQASSVPEIYTNIYIISYNQNPEGATTDIFGQLLQYWKFNIDVKNCSKTVTQACTGDSSSTNNDCPDGEICQPVGYCSSTNTKACLIDQDCPQDEYCTSKKATIIRDTKRLADLKYVKDLLETNVNKGLAYPQLNTGTYVTNKTISVWPSWVATLSPAANSNLPIDPINKLGRCKTDDNDNARFDATTCWDENAKEFAGSINPYFTMPANSHVYYYKYTPSGNKFSFCTITESGYIQGGNPGTVYCQTGANCHRSCTNKNCGDDGCGGSCGSCTASQVCQSGRCILRTPAGTD